MTFGRVVRGTTIQKTLAVANRGTLDLTIGSVTRQQRRSPCSAMAAPG